MEWSLEEIKRACVIDDESGCWIWTKAKISAGYGFVRIDGKMTYVHRLVASNGRELAANSEVCHRCHAPACVNPDHLYIGDRVTNARDMVEAGRSAKGETHSQNKLSEAEIARIRFIARTGMAQSEIAKVFSVSQSAISLILSRKRWRHL